MKSSSLVLVLALALSGCAFHAGRIQPNDCGCVYVSVGDAGGPCGLEGASISLPGVALLGGVFDVVKDTAMGLLGRAPIRIEHVTENFPDPSSPEESPE